MPLQVESVFGSYDLFAKTIPGIVFFLGILSLLPLAPEISTEEGGFALVTISIVVALVFGFMVGQALHSIAVAIEGALYIFGKYVYNRFPRTRRETWVNRRGVFQKISEPSEKSREILLLSVPLRVPASLLINLYCWIVIQVHGLLIPHRIWFRSKLEKELREKEDTDPLYDWFKIQCRDHLRNFELDLPERHQDVYRFVMSYLEFVGNGRARKFQATASFCRSMWITFAFYTGVYTILIFMGSESVFGFESNIQPMLIDYGNIIVFSLSLCCLLFMYSTKQYKKHFTEYIVVDFYTVHNMDVLDQ